MTRQAKQEFLGDADVIIIGGGPAGCATALFLQRIDPALAARSLIVEKDHHPREKTCGGALTLNAERLLSELDIPLNIPSAPVDHVQLTYGQAKIDLPETGCAKRVIRRKEFDALLFQTVKDRGIRSLEGIKVTKVNRKADHLLVMTTRGHLRAQAVVGADGVGAVVRRTPGFDGGRMGRLWVAEVPADPAVARGWVEKVLTIDLSYIAEGLKGYYWEFPCYISGRAHCSCGIVDSSPRGKPQRGSSRYLSKILEQRGIDATHAVRSAFPIRHFDSRERFARPRMLLVGDALGTDPLFSEGISQALEFGRLAAHALSDGFRRSNLSFARFTRDVFRSRVGKELAAYARFARLLYGPRAELLLSLLYERPEFRELVGCSYAGTENMHDRMLRLTRGMAAHLLQGKRGVRNFRAAAALAERP